MIRTAASTDSVGTACTIRTRWARGTEKWHCHSQDADVHSQDGEVVVRMARMGTIARERGDR
jgi:hypothetical protein